MNAALSMAIASLEKISERDPQSNTCGPHAPDICENGCIGCIARAALSNVRCELESSRYDTEQFLERFGVKMKI